MDDFKQIVEEFGNFEIYENYLLEMAEIKKKRKYGNPMVFRASPEVSRPGQDKSKKGGDHNYLRIKVRISGSGGRYDMDNSFTMEFKKNGDFHSIRTRDGKFLTPPSIAGVKSKDILALTKYVKDRFIIFQALWDMKYKGKPFSDGDFREALEFCHKEKMKPEDAIEKVMREDDE